MRNPWPNNPMRLSNSCCVRTALMLGALLYGTALQATEGQNVCKVYYFKTPERERILYFSRSSTVFLSNHVVMRRGPATIATQALDSGLRRNEGAANVMRAGSRG